MIADQRGVGVEDLAAIDAGGAATVTEVAKVNEMPVIEDTAPATASDEVLDDAALAAQFRSQADRMSKEEAALRRQAEELVPTKKKKSVTASA
jgi:hypothetical protein